MSTARRGAAAEHRVKRLLQAEGWAVTRGAGSHGCADLWAAKPAQLRLIQVKTDRAGPYANFRPADRKELSGLAVRTGGQAQLCWWPPGGEPAWYDESDWP